MATTIQTPPHAPCSSPVAPPETSDNPRAMNYVPRKIYTTTELFLRGHLMRCDANELRIEDRQMITEWVRKNYVWESDDYEFPTVGEGETMSNADCLRAFEVRAYDREHGY